MNVPVNKTSGYGEYVVAGADCFVSFLANFIDSTNNQYFDDDKLKTFINNSVSRYLYSFGSGLSYKSQKISKNHTAKVVTEINKIISRPFMKDSKLYIDSGGFQVAMGAIKTDDMPLFIKMYHDFIDNNFSKFSYAFSLDLPPGPESASKIFRSYEQLENLNKLSYETAAALPQNRKDKMIYIHHFRTPSLYNTWSKFLWEYNLADGFTNFATGGIVANSSTDIFIPIIIYTIPLSEILRYAISKGMKKFNFHVLGGANYIDVFYHKLFSYHIKQVHNIDVTITYDSSAIFKALAVGRFIPVFSDDGNLMKMDLRSNGLHLRFDNTTTIEDKVFDLINNIARNFDFKELNKVDDPIYSENDKGKIVLTKRLYMYMICYYLEAYRMLELISENFVREIYPLFVEGKIDEFDERCYAFAQKFNQGKNTKKQKTKIASLYKSLCVLTDMDAEYNKHIIDKFMSCDDISTMNNGGIQPF